MARDSFVHLHLHTQVEVVGCDECARREGDDEGSNGGIEAKMGTCSVDLATKTLRFDGCEDRDARRAAVKVRLGLLKDMMTRPKGFTNRERRAMKREKDFLLWALYPIDSIDRRLERWKKAHPWESLIERRGWVIHLRKSPDAWAQGQLFDAEWEKHFGHVL